MQKRVIQTGITAVLTGIIPNRTGIIRAVTGITAPVTGIIALRITIPLTAFTTTMATAQAIRHIRQAVHTTTTLTMANATAIRHSINSRGG